MTPMMTWSENWPAIVFGLWLACGFGFWIACVQHTTPTRWQSVPREAGWDQVLTIYLLVSLIGGPLWIAASWATRHRS